MIILCNLINFIKRTSYEQLLADMLVEILGDVLVDMLVEILVDMLVDR